MTYLSYLNFKSVHYISITKSNKTNPYNDGFYFNRFTYYYTVNLHEVLMQVMLLRKRTNNLFNRMIKQNKIITR